MWGPLVGMERIREGRRGERDVSAVGLREGKTLHCSLLSDYISGGGCK